MKLVVSLKTTPLRNNRTTSLMGCNIPGPLRPEARLFVRIIIPVKKRAANKINRTLSMVIIV
jgi:hypothetical protein